MSPAAKRLSAYLMAFLSLHSVRKILLNFLYACPLQSLGLASIANLALERMEHPQPLDVLPGHAELVVVVGEVNVGMWAKNLFFAKASFACWMLGLDVGGSLMYLLRLQRSPTILNSSFSLFGTSINGLDWRHPPCRGRSGHPSLPRHPSLLLIVPSSCLSTLAGKPSGWTVAALQS